VQNFVVAASLCGGSGRRDTLLYKFAPSKRRERIL
jgi:hypothetical protein